MPDPESPPVPDADRVFWNLKHGQVTVGGGTPRPWLVDHEALINEQLPGRALDVACGRGNDALYFAQLGFEVDALDVSDVAVDRVRTAAQERGLDVQATRVDLLTTPEPFPRPPYDVISGFYFLLRPLLPRLAQVLAPGGLLFYETFSRDHDELLGRDMPKRYMLDHNELLTAFADLRVLDYRDTVIGEERARAVASIVARRPASE